MKATAALLMALSMPLAAQVAKPEQTVFCGRSLGHRHIQGVHMTCPEGYVCIDAWFRWTLHVDGVVSGPALPAEVSAAGIQHTRFMPEYESRLRLFVVEPIEDEARRKLLGADYELRARVPADAPRASPCATPQESGRSNG